MKSLPTVGKNLVERRVEMIRKTENEAGSEDDGWVQDSGDGGGGEAGPEGRVGCGDEDAGVGGMLSGRRGRGWCGGGKRLRMELRREGYNVGE